MKTFVLNLCIAVCLLVGYESCLHTPQELPPITTEGKRTFGCKVNGSLWIPKTGWMASGYTLSVVYSPQLDTTFLQISQGIKDVGTIYMNIYDTPSIVEGNTYELSDPRFNVFYISDVNSLCYYETITSGSLTILRFDPMNEIVSGTFSFNASVTTQGCEPAEVHITEGRFDLTINSW